jgi:hypothetical protein
MKAPPAVFWPTRVRQHPVLVFSIPKTKRSRSTRILSGHQLDIRSETCTSKFASGDQEWQQFRIIDDPLTIGAYFRFFTKKKSEVETNSCAFRYRFYYDTVRITRLCRGLLGLLDWGIINPPPVECCLDYWIGASLIHRRSILY